MYDHDKDREWLAKHGFYLFRKDPKSEVWRGDIRVGVISRSIVVPYDNELGCWGSMQLLTDDYKPLLSDRGTSEEVLKELHEKFEFWHRDFIEEHPNMFQKLCKE